MRLLPLLALSLVLGCKPTREAPSPNPPVPPDTNLCGPMCVHLREIHCEEGQPFYDSDKPGPLDVPNTSCEEFCTSQQMAGVYVNPKCVAKVPACPDIEAWRKKDRDQDPGCN